MQDFVYHITNVRSSISTFNKMNEGFDYFKYTLYEKHYHVALTISFILKTLDWQLQPNLNIIKPKRTKMEWAAEERKTENARANELRELRKRYKSQPLPEQIWIELLCIAYILCILILSIVINTRKLVRYIIILWFGIFIHKCIIKSEIADDYLCYLVLLNMLIYLIFKIALQINYTLYSCFHTCWYT